MRKYILPRPSHEEVELVLWHMIFGLRQREEELKRECKEREEDWVKRERGMKDWEHDLEVRERRLGSQDGLVKMMRDLRIREGEIANKDEEIKELKNELCSNSEWFCGR